MSVPRDTYYLDPYGRQQRSPPAGDSHNGSSMPVQGRRIVLPSLTEAFPTVNLPVSGNYPGHYAQQRSTPVSYDPTSGYGHYTYGTPAAQQQPTSYNTYQQRDPRYTQQAYSAAYQGRSSPPVPTDPRHHLPPLSVPNQASYYTQSGAQVSAAMNNVRSPQAAYPPSYPQYQSMQSTGYPTTSAARTVTQAAPPYQQGHANVERTSTSRSVASAPYARGAPAIPSVEYDIDDREPSIKKKRKRADAHQLAILNDTYNRTAFPSTEERAELARKLDMTARSVQIWFQNKRQSMRQGGRQATAATTSSGSSGSVPAPARAVSPSYGGSTVASPTSMTGPSGSSAYSSRSPPPMPPSMGRHQSPSPPGGRGRTDDPRKWTTRGY
ncbi:hypothetical protein EVG20_g7381 [Dentipellis fragilis]|uniref:Homeobox domain-containing protein n=1 Tax=Dentipellis fragilis TaxID=205917 RepID=A0A4Y9YEX3_9AGAM|nr:hypothetical protein EVG20_g7381 [Dentipellis fragilis]